MRVTTPLRLAVLAFVLMPTAALAHSTAGAESGFVSGLLHPILGIDHLVAMVAVGLWGAQLGMPLLVALPVAFPLMMAVGAMLAIAGVPLPGVELGISLSALALGLVVALAFRPPLWVAVALVAAFALFHGHAHGEEIPAAASPLAYGIGFVLATGFLHLAGIAIGLLNEVRGFGPAVVRGCGGVIAAIGLVYVSGALGIA